MFQIEEKICSKDQSTADGSFPVAFKERQKSESELNLAPDIKELSGETLHSNVNESFFDFDEEEFATAGTDVQQQQLRRSSAAVELRSTYQEQFFHGSLPQPSTDGHGGNDDITLLLQQPAVEVQRQHSKW